VKDHGRHGRRRVWNTAATKDRQAKDRLKTARPRAELQQGRTDWYRIENLASSTTAIVHIYNEIGYWGTTAEDFCRELRGINASVIELHLNSPGGEAFEGIAIYNALKQHPAQVQVSVDSLAASIASVIAMAGDTITMATGSTMMIHEASGIEIGNADELRAYADLLDVVSNNVAAIYAERAGGTIESWRAAMRLETWYTAEEAVTAGLADSVTASRTAAPENSWDLSVYNYAGRDNAPAPTLLAEPAAPAAATDSGEVVVTVTPSSADLTAMSAMFAAWMRDTVLNTGSAEQPPVPDGQPATTENNETDPATFVAPTTSTVQPEDAVTEDAVAADAVVEPAPVEDETAEPAAPAVVPAAEVIEPEPAPAATEPAEPTASDDGSDPWTQLTAHLLTEPVDPWAALTSGLLAHVPAPSTPDAVFDALKEGLLR
jgi:ATP-dependent protease ClpP protease subunit